MKYVHLLSYHHEISRSAALEISDVAGRNSEDIPSLRT